MTSLVIIGAGGHGAVVADAAMLAGQWQEVLFLDDDFQKVPSVLGIPVSAGLAAMETYLVPDYELVVALGNNQLRCEIFSRLEASGAQFATVVHPNACVSPHAEIGAGAVVLAGTVVNCRARVGRNSVLNTGCRVDHDCVVGAGAFIAPGAVLAGGVNIGVRAMVGSGATIIPNIRIGPDAVVAAGAVVIEHVEAGVTVVGVPARPR